MAFTVDKLLQALELLDGAKISAAIEAVSLGDIDGEFAAVEDALAVVAVFYPPAAGAEIILEFANAIVDGYRNGTIKSAQPEDPAMQHAEGRKPGGR